MTEPRPIDVSTGRPADVRDHEVWDQIRADHGEGWRGRDGEVVRVFMTRSGLTFGGKVWHRGEMLTCVVGDDLWTQSTDPTTGESFLDLDPQQQVQRWGVRYFIPIDGEVDYEDTPDPTSDDKPYRPAPTGPAIPKGEAQMYANLRAIWDDEAEIASQPVRYESRHTGEFPD